MFANPVLGWRHARQDPRSVCLRASVVSTGVGLEGTAGDDGVHWRRADAPEAFAAALVALLRDPEGRAAMGKQARQLVETRYDARCVLVRVTDVFESVAAARRRRGALP